MKIYIISDSHGDRGNAEKIAAMMQLDDKLIFLGDGLGDVEFLKGENVYKVAGNCDFAPFDPCSMTPVIAGRKFYITHGHKDRVKSDLFRFSMSALEKNADVACFGHTHIPYCEYEYGMLMINPGSLGQGCYAVIEVKDNELSPKLMKL